MPPNSRARTSGAVTRGLEAAYEVLMCDRILDEIERRQDKHDRGPLTQNERIALGGSAVGFPLFALWAALEDNPGTRIFAAAIAAAKALVVMGMSVRIPTEAAKAVSGRYLQLADRFLQRSGYPQLDEIDGLGNTDAGALTSLVEARRKRAVGKFESARMADRHGELSEISGGLRADDYSYNAWKLTLGAENRQLEVPMVDGQVLA